MQQKILVFPNLNAELARNGLNVEMLADYMGMSKTNVYNKINGRTVFNIKDMQAIQEFFKAKGGGAFTLDYLFSNDE